MMETSSTRNRLKMMWARSRPWKVSHPDAAVLVLCGKARLNPNTAALLKTVLPPDFQSFVFAGLDGVNCHADFRDPKWRARCFGGDRTFAGVVIEYCDYVIHSDVLRAVKSLVRPAGFLLFMGHRGTPPAIPGFRLAPRSGGPHGTAAMYVRQ